MQRPKTTKGSSKLPVCKIPKHIDGGIWRRIFLFVGINKDLAKCRQVCKKWRKYFRQCIEILILDKQKSLQSVKQNWNKVLAGIPPKVKTEIEAALEMKKTYENYIELLPKKYSLFHRISDLGKLNRPPAILGYGIMAVMYLITDKEDIKKNGGRLDWSYCKKRLLDKNFVKTVKDTTYDKLTRDRVTNFQNLVEAALITPERLSFESAQAMYMMEWALKIVEFKNFVQNLDEEGKNMLEEVTIQDEKQNEIEWLNKIVQATSS